VISENMKIEANRIQNVRRSLRHGAVIAQSTFLSVGEVMIMYESMKP
jgi:hypothetical protein